MGKVQKQMLREPCPIAVSRELHKKLDDDHDDQSFNIASSTSSFEDSSISNGSTSSLDLADDDASSCTSNSTSQSNGPLDDFTELFAQLPIKRGLSKFYEGKSQSFTSLCRAQSIEDLAKKENPYNRRLNAWKSYGGGLDTHKSCTLLLKAPTFKKASRSSLSSCQVRRGSTLGSSRPPIPVCDDNF